MDLIEYYNLNRSESFKVNDKVIVNYGHYTRLPCIIIEIYKEYKTCKVAYIDSFSTIRHLFVPLEMLKHSEEN